MFFRSSTEAISGPAVAGQADERIHFGVLLHDLHGMVKGGPRVSLEIHDFRDFDLRIVGESVGISLQALLEIGLLRHSVDHHVAFAVEFARNHPAPVTPTL